MTLTGTWANDYGSLMSLSVSGDKITGVYKSSTGSTGEYVVSGWQTDAEPTEGAGQVVCLAIDWHSVEGDQQDASWNWVSALGGQLSIIQGEENLILNHLMVASSDFEGVANTGVYIDKLAYHRVETASENPRGKQLNKAKTADPLTGRWNAADGTTLLVSVIPDSEARFGYISGTLTITNNEMTISGFTDINAASDGLQFQSVSIVAKDSNKNITRALGGWIELTTSELSLQMLSNHITTVDTIYTQTDIRSLQFKKLTQN